MEYSVAYTDCLTSPLVNNPEFTTARGIPIDRSTTQRFQLFQFLNGRMGTALNDPFLYQQLIYLRKSRLILS
ncbi:MAG: hypothetical protein LBS11_07155 [Oscillospiraceae bacterium]|jgi:hypothetical protein|nr:hypothetical protein [Oscillospiraceae bacterium]